MALRKPSWQRAQSAQQSGKVVQAEEVLNGEKWRRYFGFVGVAGIQKVPAEDIEFRTPNCWKPMNEWMDVGFFWQGTEQSKAYVRVRPTHRGQTDGRLPESEESQGR